MRPSPPLLHTHPIAPLCRVVDAASDLLSQKRARVRTVEARLSSLLRGYQGGEVSQQGGRMCVVLLAGGGGGGLEGVGGTRAGGDRGRANSGGESSSQLPGEQVPCAVTLLLLSGIEPPPLPFQAPSCPRAPCCWAAAPAAACCTSSRPRRSR